MRLLLLVVLSLSLGCLAQDMPWCELYAGYQYTGYQTQQIQHLTDSLTASASLPTINAGTRLNMNGWNLSVQENKNSWLGGIIDFSGGWGSKTVILPQSGGAQASAKFKPALFTYGGGPQISYRKNERFQPFGRIIFAAVHSDLNPDSAVTSAITAQNLVARKSDTALAIITGGGLDYRLKNYAFLRVAGDYIHTSLFSQSQNSFRMTAGVEFRIRWTWWQ